MRDRLIRNFGSLPQARHVASVAMLLGAAMLSAQSPEAPITPTFRSTVNYVDVDVRVTDAQGNFVGNLSRGDFELFEDDKPQRVDTFSLVELPVEHVLPYQAFGRPIPADVHSNRDVGSG